MSAISTVENTVLTESQTTLGTTVRTYGSLPGGWTLDMMQRALQFSPGVYVAFEGMKSGQAQGLHDGRFAVYVVTKGPLDSTRRTKPVIGAYDILEALLPRLDGLTVPNIGSLRIQAVDNLFRDTMFQLGGSVYGIDLLLPNMPFDQAVDPATLDLFDTFDAQYDIDKNQTGEPVANDHVTGIYTL